MSEVLWKPPQGGKACQGQTLCLIVRVTRYFCEKIAQRQWKIAQKVAQPCFCYIYYIKLFYGVSVWFYANIQWHWTFFYSFFLHKKGDIIFWIFLRHVKNTLLEQNFSLIKVNFWQFFHDQNFAQIIGRFFLEKISP